MPSGGEGSTSVGPNWCGGLISLSRPFALAHSSIVPSSLFVVHQARQILINPGIKVFFTFHDVLRIEFS